MTTLTITETGIIQFPPNILKFLGLQKGGTVEIQPSKQGITLKPSPTITPLTNDEQQRLIDEKVNQGFGMVKIDPSNFPSHAPKQSLMDFKVTDHIQLFDNMGDE